VTSATREQARTGQFEAPLGCRRRGMAIPPLQWVTVKPARSRASPLLGPDTRSRTKSSVEARGWRSLDLSREGCPGPPRHSAFPFRRNSWNLVAHESDPTPPCRPPSHPARPSLGATSSRAPPPPLAFAGRPALPGGDQARAATAAAEPFIGEIMLFAGNFPPRGWAFCDGQVLSIAQNTALFSILGTTYGGDGVSTYRLPDLRGRVPVHAGNSSGPGLSQRFLGEMGGAEAVTLSLAQIPAHSHTLRVDTANGTTSAPNDALLARDPSGTPAYGANASGSLAAQAVATAGGSQPHQNMQPYTAINYCIALQGVFPPLN
jgi:microcystin-dependent protein